MKWIELWHRAWLNGVGRIVVPGGWSVSEEVGSGFDQDADTAARVRQLSQSCHRVVSDPTLAPANGKTYCNFAVRSVCKELGVHFFGDSDMANTMIDLMESSGAWRKDSGEMAAAHALRGGLAVAGRKYAVHGHVAVVYPAQCAISESLGHAVPLVANVGQTVGIMKSSMAFPVAEGEAVYYLYDTEGV